MKVEVDTHTHTIISGHAYNTLKEMAKTAADKGLKGLAVTDHAPDMPGSTHLYYFQNLRVVPRQMYGIELLLGAELNIRGASGEVDLSEGVLKKLDLVVASMHTPCFKDEPEKDNVTKAYVNAMENPYIDIIGHPDDGRFPVDYRALAEAAHRTGTLLELNNSSLTPGGFRVNTRENALEMLKWCRVYGTMIVLGSDSHIDSSIADTTYSGQVVKEAGFPEELIANLSLEKLKRVIKHSKM